MIELPTSTIGADPMSSLRSELCGQPVSARGGAVVQAETTSLLRVARVDGEPTSTSDPNEPLVVELYEPVLRRLRRLLGSLKAPLTGVRVTGQVVAVGGRCSITGRPTRSHRRLQVHLPRRVVESTVDQVDERRLDGHRGGRNRAGWAVAAAAWRGALLARGEWADSPDAVTDATVLGVCCPVETVAAELAGLAALLGVPSATRPQPSAASGSDVGDATGGLVVVRASGPVDVNALLGAIGARRSAAEWLPNVVVQSARAR